METRANNVFIGAFTLAVVLSVFGFVFWLHNSSGTGDRVFYRVHHPHLAGEIARAITLRTIELYH